MKKVLICIIIFICIGLIACGTTEKNQTESRTVSDAESNGTDLNSEDENYKAAFPSIKAALESIGCVDEPENVVSEYKELSENFKELNVKCTVDDKQIKIACTKVGDNWGVSYISNNNGKYYYIGSSYQLEDIYDFKTDELISKADTNYNDAMNDIKSKQESLFESQLDDFDKKLESVFD